MYLIPLLFPIGWKIWSYVWNTQDLYEWLDLTVYPRVHCCLSQHNNNIMYKLTRLFSSHSVSLMRGRKSGQLLFQDKLKYIKCMHTQTHFCPLQCICLSAWNLKAGNLIWSMSLNMNCSQILLSSHCKAWKTISDDYFSKQTFQK